MLRCETPAISAFGAYLSARISPLDTSHENRPFQGADTRDPSAFYQNRDVLNVAPDSGGRCTDAWSAGTFRPPENCGWSNAGRPSTAFSEQAFGACFGQADTAWRQQNWEEMPAPGSRSGSGWGFTFAGSEFADRYRETGVVPDMSGPEDWTTEVQETNGQIARYYHISAHPKFLAHSPEELRWQHSLNTRPPPPVDPIARADVPPPRIATDAGRVTRPVSPSRIGAEFHVTRPISRIAGEFRAPHVAPLRQSLLASSTPPLPKNVLVAAWEIATVDCPAWWPTVHLNLDDGTRKTAIVAPSRRRVPRSAGLGQHVLRLHRRGISQTASSASLERPLPIAHVPAPIAVVSMTTCAATTDAVCPGTSSTDDICSGTSSTESICPGTSSTVARHELHGGHRFRRRRPRVRATR